jgi:hypothetical protein
MPTNNHTDEDLANQAPNRNIRFCFWSSAIKIDGQIHNL